MVHNLNVNETAHKVEVVKFTTEDGQLGTLVKMNVKGHQGTFIGAAVLSPHDEDNINVGTRMAIMRAAEDFLCQNVNETGAEARALGRAIYRAWRIVRASALLEDKTAEIFQIAQTLYERLTVIAEAFRINLGIAPALDIQVSVKDQKPEVQQS